MLCLLHSFWRGNLRGSLYNCTEDLGDVNSPYHAASRDADDVHEQGHGVEHIVPTLCSESDSRTRASTEGLTKAPQRKTVKEHPTQDINATNMGDIVGMTIVPHSDVQRMPGHDLQQNASSAVPCVVVQRT